jgi:hypothetical protein
MAVAEAALNVVVDFQLHFARLDGFAENIPYDGDLQLSWKLGELGEDLLF